MLSKAGTAEHREVSTDGHCQQRYNPRATLEVITKKIFSKDFQDNARRNLKGKSLRFQRFLPSNAALLPYAIDTHLHNSE